MSEPKKSFVTWHTDEEGNYCAYVVDTETGKERKAVFAPQPGSQEAFMQVRDMVFEVLYEGERGPGKTIAILMDFAQDTGKGYGAAWRGILIRRSYPELQHVIDESRDWFPKIWNEDELKYNGAGHFWEWATGERLYLRQMEVVADYRKYHGHQYPWQGWEELTNWPDDQCFRKMQSTCRSKTRGVPRRIRATTNPYGVGHGWVKKRYALPVPHNAIHGPIIDNAVDDEGEQLPTRMAIHGCLNENQVMLQATPDYLQSLRQSATSEAEYQAWVHGDWNIVAGGMFTDVWDTKYNVITPFDVPRDWIIDRSFDWGASRPFSVGWWAESNGTDLRLHDGRVISTVRGDVFRIMEWYGWKEGKPNQGLDMLATDITKGIIEREIGAGLRGRVHPGPADTAIFTNENGPGIAADMAQSVRIDGLIRQGVTWARADKKGGSVAQGWQKMRIMLKAAHRDGYQPREKPGLFIVDTCDQFIRTIPALTRDEIKMDEVKKGSEDHIGDETRYRVRFAGRRGHTGRAIGSF